MCCDVTDACKNMPGYANYGIDSVITVSSMMSKIAKILDIPLVVTEYAKKTFGGVFPEIIETMPEDHLFYEKPMPTMVDDKTKEFFAKHKDRK
mmetsp:Transcript_9835/g.8388  ORF Transcript_9835/g.8388 Transcript_9835/m.8388 type:complete len:93 (+) Transcript_9835:79-357(+)